MLKRGRPRAVTFTIVAVMLVAAMGAAHAAGTVEEVVGVRHDLHQEVQDTLAFRRERRAEFRKMIHNSRVFLANDRLADGGWKLRHLRAKERKQIRSVERKWNRMVKRTTNRVQALKDRREQLMDWLDRYAVFLACPVQGPHEIADNFGVTVNLPGVPVHVHQGNDISAATGTPIVAPFDGTAVVSTNELGGLSVHVYGSAGYVYNAHLSRAGNTGSVQAGEVVGYVGSTGDATGPHDHFEWHPGDGSAVDPNELLHAVCG